MDRLRSGEDEAAREVFVRFAARLVGLARRHLDGRLAVKVDPEDVVQSAYKSFFIRQRDGTLDVGTWDGLWGVLTMITLRKCADRAAYYRAGKRDVPARPDRRIRRQSPDAAAEIALDREPMPEEAAVLAETVEALFRSIDDPDERSHPGAEPPGLHRDRDQRSNSAARSGRCAGSANASASGWNGCATMTTDAVNCPERPRPVP